MTIQELVGGEVISVTPDVTIRSAASEMQEIGVGSVAVVVDKNLAGILTERDILNAVAESIDLYQASVGDFMTMLPDTFGPEMSVQDASDWMLATGYRHLPVVDENGELIGMVSIKDILWAITDSATA